MTRLETTATHSEPFTTKAGRVLCAAVIALATACGGGGEATPTSPQPRPQAPVTAYSVAVKTVDTQGQPIAGVSVALNGVGNGVVATTGSDGTTTFNFNARSARDASLNTFLTGYHPAGRRFQVAGASSPIVQQLTLMRIDEAQLVLRGLTSQASADASSVVVSADIEVVGLNGNPIAGLSAAAFEVPYLDCQGFGFPCILEPSGSPLSIGYWVPSQRDPVQVTLSGAAPLSLYKVRYVLEATPGMFTAGRTVLTSLSVRVGADTSLDIQVDVRL